MIPYNAIAKGHTVADRFVVEAKLGAGRTAAVYKALDLNTRSHVALKVFDPLLTHDPIAAQRFAREAEILRVLNHPNIVKVYDLLREEAWPVICMEYFEGMDLKSYLVRYGRMPLKEFLPVATAVLSALQACHRLKVLHRDLKPQNVLINGNRDVKLVDFGVAKMSTMSDLTKTGAVFGTPEYMPPEVFRSTCPDPRSDLYSLGAVFYEMLTGRPPYVASSVAAIMTQQLRAEIEPLGSVRGDVPPWIESAILKSLRIDPGRRYQSCYELLRDLERGERTVTPDPLSDEEDLPCPHCKETLFPGLPFCHHCGLIREIVYQPGRWCLVLDRSDEIDRLHDLITRAFAVSSDAAVRRRLSRFPAVLCSGISRETAVALSHQLSAVPAELRITNRLAASLELPGLYVAPLIAVVLTLLVWRPDSVLLTVALVAAIELAIIFLYRVRTRPIIRARRLGRQKEAATVLDKTLRDIAKRLAQVQDSNLRTILAYIVRSFLRLRQDASVASAACSDAVRRGVDLALDAAQVIEGHEMYLASTSVSDIKERLQAVAVRMAHSADPGELERLVNAKATLERELKNYQTIQDVHGGMYVALLNLHAVLQKIQDTVGKQAPVAQLGEELHVLEADLACGAAEHPASRCSKQPQTTTYCW
jgi:eukaryotic-like serine/threonine-protein kinase